MSIRTADTQRPRAVILLSGGLDSATIAAIAREQGFDVYAMTFRYGQRHSHELDAARAVARAAGVCEHVFVDIDLATFGGSALTDENLEVPQGDDPTEGIPVTYVPARNTIFLSFALAWAEVLGAVDLFIGVNAVDYSGYPDCRPEFIAAFEQMANLATKVAVEGAKIRVHTPLIAWSKTEIIQAGLARGVDYGLTSTCYAPDAQGRACGRCDACHLRLRGFAGAGVEDPIAYQTRK